MLNGRQNRTLVLEGEQNIGKSSFARWLCKPFGDQYFSEDPPDPDDKDSRIAQTTTFIWEIKELGSVTRRADLEAWKAFLTFESIKARPPYGRYEIRKPPITSFIATANNSGGIYNDPTGSRRYMTTTLLTINFDYSRDVDVSQVWAQAVALYKSGDLGKLSREDAKRIAAINDEYAFEPVSYDWLNRYIEDSPESFVPTYEITMAMKSDMDIRSDNQLTREIAGWMVKHGYKEGRSRVDVASDDHGKLLPSKKMVRGYFGAKLTPPHKLTIYDKRGGVGSSL